LKCVRPDRRVSRRHLGRECGRRGTQPRAAAASIVGPPEARPVEGLAADFVVESGRAQL